MFGNHTFFIERIYQAKPEDDGGYVYTQREISTKSIRKRVCTKKKSEGCGLRELRGRTFLAQRKRENSLYVHSTYQIIIHKYLWYVVDTYNKDAHNLGR
jgi:hypothetical protein